MRPDRRGFIGPLPCALLAAIALRAAGFAQAQRPPEAQRPPAAQPTRAHALGPAKARAVAEAVRPEIVRAHLEFLADDALEGRGTGTRGGDLAARYVAAQFASLGLEPAGDHGSYFARGGPMNVIARLPGRGRLASEAVILGAHYDHLGIGPAVGGDSIYNGAVDNASGTAGMLAIAEAFVTAGARPARSVFFVAFDAEEKGLLGAKALIRRPPVPLAQVVAMLNLESLNLVGDTRDIAALGADRSTLGTLFRVAAAAEGYTVTPRSAAVMQEAERQGFFDRSDQAAFVQAGVPAIMLFLGDQAGGDQPRGWAKRMLDQYLQQRYHQPNDDLSLVGDLGATAHALRVYARTLLAVADQPARARWVTDVH